jgi:hypothetical protein
MFCSPQCRDEFYNNSASDFYKDKFDIMTVLINKMSKAFGGYSKMKTFSDNVKKGEKSFYDLDFTDADQNDLNVCKAFFMSCRDVADANHRNLTQVFGLNYGKKGYPMNVLILGILMGNFKHNSVLDTKFLEQCRNLKESKLMLDAVCFSTFSDLINSSCVPNIDFVTIGEKIVVYVKRPIKTNEQLFFAYT